MVNEKIIETLNLSKETLSEDAISHISEFLLSTNHQNGGFVDRAGKVDPYYSVFGYTLAFVLDFDIDIDRELTFLDIWCKENNPDLVHAVSVVQCYFLLYSIKEKSKLNSITKSLAGVSILRDRVKRGVATKVKSLCADMLEIIESYKSQKFGYNHTKASAKRGTIYGNYLVLNLYYDLGVDVDVDEIMSSITTLQCTDGAFVNDDFTKSGVTSSTAAGAVLLKYINHSNYSKSIEWLKSHFNKHGGCLASTGLPIADLLSTGTALFALKFCGESMVEFDNSAEFVDMHWDESGGFFGSIADMHPDCEYTFYALLALGAVS